MSRTDEIGVHDLRAEQTAAALGIGTAAPRLGWWTSAPPAWRQQRYVVEALGDDGEFRTATVTSGDSVLVPWPFAPLVSRQHLRVRVRPEDASGAGAWSAPLDVEAGLLEPGDWTAVPVEPADGVADSTGSAALVRAEFTLTQPVVSARLHVTAHGVHEVELNGRRTDDAVLAPGWTSYPSRLVVTTLDVTDLLLPGANAIGAVLADGWYRGRLGFGGGTDRLYGDRLALLAQLEVRHPDGSVTTVATDDRWTSAAGPIVASGLYDGEHHDARLERPGWSSVGGGDDGWRPVRLGARDPATLVAAEAPPIRRTQRLRPVAAWTSPEGLLLLDFGQNLTGRLRIRVRGDAGSVVRIRHAEVLEHGGLCTRPLRDAAATDVYVLRGGGEEEWEPRFTLHGFRYAEIDGWPGGDPAQAVEAVVVHSDLERTGRFACSDPRVERLHENVLWSMRGNFVSIPTDCPQRDERLGWTGDIQVFAPTAAFLHDCAGFLSSWLRDVAAEQEADGTVPWYVPTIPGGSWWTPSRPGAVWGDVAVLTPWTLWERFGDRAVLARQWSSAVAWVELVERLSGDDHLWDEGFQLGDWLDPAAPPEDPSLARTDRSLVATAYAAHTARTLASTAAVLGNDREAHRFARLADDVRQAFRSRWTVDGRLTEDTQTALALAIRFGLLDDAETAAAGDRLAALVREAGHTIATGFAGTPLICDALTDTGHVDTAYALLLEESCPSWLYAVRMGATTIWERWDSLLPDGTVNPGGMTSFNHYALGAVADWLHRVVAGVAPAAPGYRAIRFAPQPGGGLTHAAADVRTPYGPAGIEWRLADGELAVEVTVPTGATGEVVLPGGRREACGPGRHRFFAPVGAGAELTGPRSSPAR